MKTRFEDNDSIATLIKWADGTDPERIRRWLEKMKEAGHIEYTNTQEYNEEYSAPVLYFP